ncbi:MAG TPA: GNAT family N-acetyltransferase [Nocardioides sp.]
MRVREVAPRDLFELSGDLYLRHRLDLDALTRAWVCGDAFAVYGARYQRPGTNLTVLGPPDDVEPLLASLVELRPDQLGLDVHSEDRLPAGWTLLPAIRWHWMLSSTQTPMTATVTPLDPDHDAAAIDGVLDVAYPDAFRRPGEPGADYWAGVRSADGRVVAVGALERTGGGTAYLRAVTTLPTHRGRGLGAAVSAHLTNVALTWPNGVATLAVTTANHGARRIYERLGYRTVRTLVGGRLEG